MEANTSTKSEPGTSPGGAPTVSGGSPAAAGGLPAGVPAGLERLAAAVAELAAADPAGLGQALQAEQLLGLRRLLDQLEACWLRLLAAVDASGAAGAEAGVQAQSTAGWLRA